ncbi:MAG: acyl carrier protein [Promethearchaeota archaeon]|jgi:acyl carrier protein
MENYTINDRSRDDNKQLITESVIFEKVREAIVLALGVEEEEVKKEASLIDDLGAESIDFLDIAFRLERIFEIRLARANILEKAIAIFGEESIVNEGILTETAISLIMDRMPEMESSKISEEMTEEDIAPFFTVQTWIRAVNEILKALPKKCQQCGSNEFGVENEVKIKCKSCGEKAAFPTGDDLIEEWLKKAHRDIKNGRG